MAEVAFVAIPLILEVPLHPSPSLPPTADWLGGSSGLAADWLGGKNSVIFKPTVFVSLLTGSEQRGPQPIGWGYAGEPARLKDLPSSPLLL